MSAATIIQARMGSSRAPGKISHALGDERMLEYQIRRLQAGGIEDIIVATTDRDRDDLTEAMAVAAGVPCFRGSEDDVMGRYLACAEAFDVDHIVRVGGDDPLIDPAGVKYLIAEQAATGTDLVYASHPGGWIYGTAGELVSRAALLRASELTDDPLDREHVVSFLKKTSAFCRIPSAPPQASQIRPDIYLSVDYQEDLDLVEQIVAEFSQRGKRYDFTQDDLILLYDSGVLNIQNRHLHKGF